MARLRTKGEHSAQANVLQRSNRKQIHKSKDVSGRDVLALGGSEADVDLLKDVDDNAVSGSTNTDPTFPIDVSTFLKDLNLKEGQPKSYKSKGKERQREIPHPKKPTKEVENRKPSKKEKRPAASNPELTLGSAHVEEPKVKLPTKASFNPRAHFTFPPSSHWYAALPPLGPLPSSTPTVTPAQLSTLSTKAAELQIKDITTFQTSSSAGSSSSEASFLSKIIQSGTLSDRLSALTLLVQSSPLHNIKALETLKGMAERGKGKGGREESLKALRCIVDWWVGGGAPSRKLKYFRDQQLCHPLITNEYLLVWYFEDWLKKYFFSILQILETLSLDPLPYVRTQTITLIFTLLRDNPEQEQNLLRLLVNKLGDTEKSLCSRASYHLLQLLQTHPSMKSVIVHEIIALVLKPATPVASTSSVPPANKHVRFSESDTPKPKPKAAEKEKGGNEHARYYATVTFNQIVLTPGDREVALKLLDVYFEMFKELLGEGVEDTEEVLGNKADDEVKTDKKGRVMEGRKGKSKGRSKKNEVKGAAGFTEVEDSNSKLISAILTGVNRALPFAKIDAGDAGINKHIDTLFLITHTSTFNISLQALMLIQQISASLSSSSSTAKSIADRYYRTLYASLHDTRLASSSKQAMYLNLLFKSIKADAAPGDNAERIKALIRRFVQVLVSGGSGATEFVAGGLYLLGEVFSSVPGVRAMINQPPKDATPEDVYDPRKRDPQFAHASSSPLWELTPLLSHYHPAISLHARQLLSSQPLTASADLSQNTLSHFLDRFVYKNPKKLKSKEGDDDTMQAQGLGRGASAMQPAASAVDGVKLIKGEVGFAGGKMVNEKAFLSKKRADVPVDQIFFHEYFTRKNDKEKLLAAKAKKRKDGKDEGLEDDDDDDEEEEHEGHETESSAELDKKIGSDWDEDVDSDEEEAEIWKAMKATMPKTDGDEDLMEDSEEANDEDDDEVNLDDDSELAPSDEEGVDQELDAEDSDDQDIRSLIEASDNDDLVSLDGDVPDGLIEYDGPEDGEAVGVDEEAEWGGIGSENSKKRKNEETKGGRRKKLRSLPTFASYEDYAKMIEEGPEDDI